MTNATTLLPIEWTVAYTQAVNAGLTDVAYLLEVLHANRATLPQQERGEPDNSVRDGAVWRELKDHEIAKLVNDLRDIAVTFGQTQQLRARIHNRFLPELKAAQSSSVREQPIGYLYRQDNTNKVSYLDAKTRTKEGEVDRDWKLIETLYTAPPDAQAIRRSALEEAMINLPPPTAPSDDFNYNEGVGAAIKECAASIRALIGKTFPTTVRKHIDDYE